MNRVRCEACGEWYCLRHAKHAGECSCIPCQGCGDLLAPRAIVDGLCATCAIDPQHARKDNAEP